jgi:hypothetical protein
MKTAWRHGVLGVDDADSKTTSCFYADKKIQNDIAKQARD